jgi:hypothetical protein
MGTEALTSRLNRQRPGGRESRENGVFERVGEIQRRRRTSRVLGAQEVSLRVSLTAKFNSRRALNVSKNDKHELGRGFLMERLVKV